VSEQSKSMFYDVTYDFFRVSGGTNKVLKPFSVVDVRGRRSSRQFVARRMLQPKIIWLADCSSAPQMHLGVS